MGVEIDWRSKAFSRWRRLGPYLEGTGPVALLAYCPPAVTVYLFDTTEEAEARKAFLDAMSCGSGCWRSGDVHQVIDMRARQKAKTPLFLRV
jgi:hypothetical protein